MKPSRVRFSAEVHEDKGAACVRATADGREVGSGCLSPGGDFMEVGSIYVTPALQRRRIGTAIYERLARLSCQRFGRPLASSDMDYRSKYSDGFWRKQARKGRASCEDGRAPVGDLCWRFVLDCPPPRSLGRPRR